MTPKRVLALLAAMAINVPGFAATLSTDAVEAHAGMLTIADYAPDGFDGFGFPIVVVGASTVLALETLPAPWVLGLGVDLFGAWYLWNDVDRRAGQGERNDGESFLTLGFVASPRFGARWNLGEAVTMGGFASLDLLVRFPFAPFSTSTDFATERLPALGYFLAGRFLYPGLGWWMTWRATEHLEFAFSLRGMAPLYRAWAREVPDFLHLFGLMGTIGATIPLGKTVTIGAPAASATPAEAAPAEATPASP